MKRFSRSFNSILNAMGLVFGDIGTSPIYTFTVIFLTVSVSLKNITGILSLIIWTLLLVVTIQYSWFAMSLGKRGEGGSIVLFEILKKLLKNSRPVMFFTFLTFIAVSLIIGDSVITPAISILSAVEGLRLLHPFAALSEHIVLGVTIIITMILFSFQKCGTEKISGVFGPIMAIWFFALAGFGLVSLFRAPELLYAFNPLNGINFLAHHGVAGFFILSEVILCATGAEALYADMGHLGREPIVKAWYVVLAALILNYLGQGAFLLTHPETKNILFSMVMSECKFLYLPFLILSLAATIIASQAMISGLFSIIYQGINTRIFPLLKIKYTSKKISSQIYIPAVNWFLLFFVVLVIAMFKESSKLAAAYGMAVTATIAITGLMISTIFLLRRKYLYSIAAALILVVDFCFFIATCSKFVHGAYVTFLIAAIPFFILILYTEGNKKLYESMVFMSKEEFIEKYNKIYNNISKVKGTALFFTRGIDKVPPYVIQTMFTNNIIYTDNIFISVRKSGEPLGLDYVLSEVEEGLKILTIKVGYMQIFKLEKVLKKLGIKEKVIFYGVEEIETENVYWNIFALIKKITPTFVSFYNMPYHKMHGVINKICLKSK